MLCTGGKCRIYNKVIHNILLRLCLFLSISFINDLRTGEVDDYLCDALLQLRCSQERDAQRVKSDFVLSPGLIKISS